MDFTLLQKVKVLAAPGCVAECGGILRDGGYAKALLVCDGGVKATGIADRVIESLKAAGLKYAMFDRVQPDPPA